MHALNVTRAVVGGIAAEIEVLASADKLLEVDRRAGADGSGTEEPLGLSGDDEASDGGEDDGGLHGKVLCRLTLIVW